MEKHGGGVCERKKCLNGIIKQNKSNERKQEKMLGRKNIHNRNGRLKELRENTRRKTN